MRVSMFRTLSILLLFVITFSVTFVSTGLAQPSDETPVTFPDTNLEAAIREAIDKPPNRATIQLQYMEHIRILSFGVAIEV